MANKTIHDLSPASTVSGNYEFAVYDTDGSTTKKATANQILSISDFLYADDDDEPTGEVDFTSQDELNPSSSVSVDILSGNDGWSQRFVKISQMFKNIRFLINKLGTTDISSIGNGTVTGAISTLNTLNNDLSNWNVSNIGSNSYGYLAGMYNSSLKLALVYWTGNSTAVPSTQEFNFSIASDSLKHFQSNYTITAPLRNGSAIGVRSRAVADPNVIRVIVTAGTYSAGILMYPTA